MRKTASFYFFRRKPIVLKDRTELWRKVAGLLGLTPRERLRVEWMVFYYTAAGGNATLTAQHFGLSRKTFNIGLKRFRESKYDVHSLADRSRAPCHKRKWEVSPIRKGRIRGLSSSGERLVNDGRPPGSKAGFASGPLFRSC